MNGEIWYREHRHWLQNLAYRMLGTIADAEDAVQDVFARLASSDPIELHHPRAYLAKLTTNRCLNMLKSARRRRTDYIGPWLPEPLVESNQPGPEEQLERLDDISYAWLVLLERLTPAERAVFVLRESFGYGYDELAALLDKTAVNCRKLHSRAAAKLKAAPVAAGQPPREQAEAWMHAFLQAARQGDFSAVAGRLAEEAQLITDGGGRTKAALKPIRSRDRIVSFLRGIAAKGALEGDWTPVLVNGQPGLFHRGPHHNKAIAFGWTPGLDRVAAVYWISNPDKLSHVSG